MLAIHYAVRAFIASRNGAPSFTSPSVGYLVLSARAYIPEAARFSAREWNFRRRWCVDSRSGYGGWFEGGGLMMDVREVRNRFWIFAKDLFRV